MPFSDPDHSLSFEPGSATAMSGSARHSKSSLVHERICFGTKAETLERLAPVLKNATVLEQIRFTVSQWRNQGAAWLVEQLRQKGWLDIPVIVRSSARAEDGCEASLAGHFQSVPDVCGKTALCDAIEQVIASYGPSAFDEQVFVQPMLNDVAFSGVAFSIDPNSGSPYVVVNLCTGSTTAVTSGTATAARTFYYLKGSPAQKLSRPFDLVIALVEELEAVMGHDRLDIEFAVDANDRVYLLQCRPLSYKGSIPGPDQLRVPLTQIRDKIISLSKPHPYLLGSRSIFAVMPDWNPAEIIGIRPRPLALSMYKELITDNIWAYQRSNYGYRNLRSFPLIVSFCGLPYVDVRLDFNSFVPADVPEDLGHRLVDFYLERLIANPAHHDKIEFEIVHTCYTFDLRDRMGELGQAGFSEQDCQLLATSLRHLTNRIIREKNGLWRTDSDKINRLQHRIKNILSSDLDTVSKIYWLLEDCKRYGTLPFAGLARAGFIAVQLLKSLVTVGVFSPADYDNFMSSLESISGRMTRDFRTLSRSAFLKEYGHLRPGTYDILSPRYDEDPDRYFDWAKAGEYAPPEDIVKEFNLSLNQLRKIDRLLSEHGLEHDVLGFFEFIRAAIEGREFAKFVFTRSLSNALSLFKELGAQHGFSADDCSFAVIDCIKELYSSSNDIGSVLRYSIEKGRKDYEATCRLRLPSVMLNHEDIWCFEVLPSEPNFITQKSAVGKVVFATGETRELKDSILFIPSADPGFDWIFSHGVAGFVTMYGGVNSHMAIRAGEMEIPAAIGVGEILYDEWSKASVLQIDCANRQVLRIK